MSTTPWYKLRDEDQVDTPALVIFRDRVASNIDALIASIDDIQRLRPHVKTHKSAEVTRMLVDKRITKFKCATISEAEMLAESGAKDILLAHQPVGPKMMRLLALTQRFPLIRWATLIDNTATAKSLSDIFSASGKTLEYFFDLNVGMNRSGIDPTHVPGLFGEIHSLPGISLRGLHVYDGHIRDADFSKRTERCDAAFAPVPTLLEKLSRQVDQPLIIVAGGSPTYPIHARRKGIECSPGTFIYWDKGYETILSEQKYLHAAVLLTRVISVPAPNTICLDLGHKAIASENPIDKRISLLNTDDLEPIGHSEEHMVFRVTGDNHYKVGDVIYGIPYHVCPTVALYDTAYVAQDNTITDRWQTLSRNRKITI